MSRVKTALPQVTRPLMTPNLDSQTRNTFIFFIKTRIFLWEILPLPEVVPDDGEGRGVDEREPKSQEKTVADVQGHDLNKKTNFKI